MSHFHGDHVPLKNANPYQLNIKRVNELNPNVRIWTKNSSHFSSVEKKRAEYLSLLSNNGLIPAERKLEGVMTFSGSVPHGELKGNSETVMMTKIEEEGKIFVHASDIQLLNNKSVSQILNWKPDIALVGGPPLYLSILSENQVKHAWLNAKKLSGRVDTLILDHHLMRNYEGLKWIKQLSSETGSKVMCGADFMGKPRMLLEANRQYLYEKMPVPNGWHKDYVKGKVSTNDYWELGKKLYKNLRLGE